MNDINHQLKLLTPTDLIRCNIYKENKKTLNNILNQKNTFLVGSKYWFSNFQNKFHDIDVIVFDELYKEKNNNSKLRHLSIINSNLQMIEYYDIFYRKPIKSPQVFIKEVKNHERSAYEILELLIPEIVHQYKFTINDLKELRPYLILNKQHHYYNLIADFYIQNNDFYLTDKQLQIVYNDYLQNHNNKIHEIKMI